MRLDTGAEQLADIVRALDHAHVAVANLALHEPTLDDVFLAKTGRSLEGAAAADAAGDPDADGVSPPPAGRREHAAA